MKWKYLPIWKKNRIRQYWVLAFLLCLLLSFSLFFVLIIACPEELFKSTGQAIFTNNILLTACINYDRRGIIAIA